MEAVSNETMEHVDLAVVGGGIHGVAVACEAAQRGLRVLLCEQGDLACGTSSASSQLIHGGLRYLEHGSLSLVRASLKAQKELLQQAPHLVHPVSFYLPHQAGMRPSWWLRLGLWVYDHLGGRRHLPSSGRIHFSNDPTTNPLNLRYRTGFHYADCQTNDARLVITLALAAAQAGALIHTRTSCHTMHSDAVGHLLHLKSGDRAWVCQAKAVVNATGPWVEAWLNQATEVHDSPRVRLIQGSHLVTRRLYPGSEAYVLQHVDGRVIFVAPYGAHYSMIGTTDVPFYGHDPGQVTISSEEISYLIGVVNHYFHHPINHNDVIHTWSGVRCLWDDGKADLAQVRREGMVINHAPHGAPALLSIYGGKLTTHRMMAREVMACLKHLKPEHPVPPTPQHLPGGDLPPGGVGALTKELLHLGPDLPEPLLARWAHNYGTRARLLMEGVHSVSDLGQHFGHGLYAHEVSFLVATEWARTVDDVLWRRTRLGLVFEEVAREALRVYLAEAA